MLMFFVITVARLTATMASNELPEKRHTDSACYGNGTVFTSLQPECNSTSVLAIQSVIVGAKNSSSGCFQYNSVNSTGKYFDNCCKKNMATDCCMDYDVTNRTLKYELQNTCTGRSTCSTSVGLQMMNTNASLCASPGYLPLTNYMSAEYYCIPNSRIIDCSSNKTLKGESGNALYIQSPNYPVTVFSSNITCTCVVETDSSNTIKVYAVDVQLNPDETLTVTNSDSTCNSTIWNNNYNITEVYSSTTNQVFIGYFNTNNTNGGKFWIAFVASNKGNLSVSCPGIKDPFNCTSTETTSLSLITTPFRTVTTTRGYSNAGHSSQSGMSSSYQNQAGSSTYTYLITTPLRNVGTPSKSSDAYLYIIVAAVVTVLIVVIVSVCIYKKCPRNKSEVVNNEIDVEKMERQNVNETKGSKECREDNTQRDEIRTTEGKDGVESLPFELPPVNKHSIMTSRPPSGTRQAGLKLEESSMSRYNSLLPIEETVDHKLNQGKRKKKKEKKTKVKKKDKAMSELSVIDDNESNQNIEDIMAQSDAKDDDGRRKRKKKKHRSKLKDNDNQNDLSITGDSSVKHLDKNVYEEYQSTESTLEARLLHDQETFLLNERRNVPGTKTVENSNCNSSSITDNHEHTATPVTNTLDKQDQKSDIINSEAEQTANKKKKKKHKMKKRKPTEPMEQSVTYDQNGFLNREGMEAGVKVERIGLPKELTEVA